MESSEYDLTSLTADIVSAYVANNAVGSDKLSELIGSVYGALSRASLRPVDLETVELKPAVAIKKSVTPEYLICLEDGKKFKSLKRHLKTHYDLSPEDYREKWGLPRDYPMVAPNYAAARSDLAKNMGLGRRAAAVAAAQPEAPAAVKPAKARREANAENDQRIGEVGWIVSECSARRGGRLTKSVTRFGGRRRFVHSSAQSRYRRRSSLCNLGECL
jgi:MucR family transcriptional regulator, transcriptional regulator of exopolysaccharide biosynthesis